VKKIKLKIIFLVLVGFLQISNSFVFGVGHPTDVEEEDNCSICLEPFSQDGREIRTFSCGHCLHEDCFQEMLRTADHDVAERCTLCRERHRVVLGSAPIVLECRIGSIDDFERAHSELMEYNQNGQPIDLTLYLGISSEIPENFFDEDINNNLVSLTIRGGHLTSLPESIGRLTNLRSLDLSDNKLSSLPDSISSLQSLNRINLRCNRFVRKPRLPDGVNFSFYPQFLMTICCCVVVPLLVYVYF